MLALGSLQMTKLQGLPATAAMKHYHLSLRRIAKNYQSVTRRTQPATLAATLLLGFYEVWNSDHEKWCKHMWGARAIFREIPLHEMTWGVRALKRLKRRSRQQELFNEANQGYGQPLDPSNMVRDGDVDEIDCELISQLTGRPVTFASPPHSTSGRYTERDVENFERLSDLFWWYCKMDVYQSVLGGTKLL
jgi:hypothetical protein